MEKIHLIQITEKLPPSLHGIGDYAYNLAHKFKGENSIDTSFLIFNTIKEDSEVLQEFPIYCLPQLKATLDQTLIQLIKLNKNKKNIIILHFDQGIYDIYINKKLYKRYDLPFNLLNSLKQFRKTYNKTQIIIVFHEFLSPKIERRRDYVLRPLHNLFMRSIIKLANASVCSNPIVEKQILKLCPQAKIFTCPVFSNIGEPSQNTLESKKEGFWVIFGSTNNLIRTLEKFISHLPLIIKSQTINTVYILGGQRNNVILDLTSEIKKQVPSVNYYPEISNQVAREIFEICKFCYMYYFTPETVSYADLIFKSGVFAASCSHGVIPVFGNKGMEDAAGVFEHPGFVYLENNQFNFPEINKLNNLAKDLFYWYQKRSSLQNAVNTFLNVIKSI